MAGQNPTREGVEVIATGKFSPYAGRNFPTRVFFGGTHLLSGIHPKIMARPTGFEPVAPRLGKRSFFMKIYITS